jgi:site-specific DNA-methyltransferase (adenine-specific)
MTAMTTHLQRRLTAFDFTCLVVTGDCADILGQLPDGVIDLSIFDPAYQSLERHRAKGTTTRLKQSKASSNKWFAFFPNSRYGELFVELHRVHRRDTHAYCFCDDETEHVMLTGRNPYNKEPPVRSALDAGWRAWPPIIWVKTKNNVDPRIDVEDRLAQEDVRSGMGYHWRRAEERIVFFERGKRKLNHLGWPNIVVGPKAGGGQFPTTKPESVIERLILNSSNEGDVVLDCFAGSGVVGRVAVRLGRKAIMIDIDTSWIEAHPIDGMEVIR